MSQHRDHLGLIGAAAQTAPWPETLAGWARMLDLPVTRCVSHPLAPGAGPGQQRAVLQRIAQQGRYRGAVVVDPALTLAPELFDEVRSDDGGFPNPWWVNSPRVASFRISSFRIAGGRVVGHLTDPAAATVALDELWPGRPADPGPAGRAALILGTRGAACLLGRALTRKDRRPARVIVADTDQARLDRLVADMGGPDAPTGLRAVQVRGLPEAAAVVQALPEGSLIIHPGDPHGPGGASPVPDEIRWPEGGTVWDLAPRGSPFWRQARLAAPTYRLRVVDGLRLQLHTVLWAVAAALQVPLVPEVAAAAVGWAATGRKPGHPRGGAT